MNGNASFSETSMYMKASWLVVKVQGAQQSD